MGKNRHCGNQRVGELPLGTSPWDDLQTRQPRVYTECAIEMSVGHAVTVPAKGPSRTWHVPTASSQAVGHPAAVQADSTLLETQEAARSPAAALKPRTEETLKVMDIWVPGDRLFSIFLLPLAPMDWLSL